MTFPGHDVDNPILGQAISSEIAVTVLTLITAILAVLVYVFALTFL